MDFDDIVQQRHSVRAYSNRPVPLKHIAALGEAARMAPSACNSQTWRFIAVTDPEKLQTICDRAMRPVVPNKWLCDVPLIMVGCSQLDLITNRAAGAISGIDYYQIDLGIAMEHMVLKATELGLGTCWIGWFKEKEIKRILSIPRSVKVLSLLTVGYPDEHDPRQRVRKPMEEILFSDSWGESFTNET